jgi:hypothetical protein
MFGLLPGSPCRSKTRSNRIHTQIAIIEEHVSFVESAAASIIAEPSPTIVGDR